MLLGNILVSNLVLCEGENIDTVETNFNIINKLSENVIRNILESSEVSLNDSISIYYNRGAEIWIVQNAINGTLNSMGYHAYLTDTISPIKKILFNILDIALSVKYDSVFRDGFLGPRKVLRNIHLIVSCQVINTQTNKILFSKTVSEKFCDIIKVSDIEKAEIPLTKYTHAELPEEPFLDRIVKPLIIISSAGVAIYLLFHVRS